MPVPSVFIHIGTPKSGTTYLQELLWAARPQLAGADVLYPGDSPAAHFHAAVELNAGNFHGFVDPEVNGAWRRLVEAAREQAGTTVISHELLGDLSAEDVARVLHDLDFAEVHVVATARDLCRQLPSVWQEDVKNRHFLPFDEFLQLVRPDSVRPDVLRPAYGGTEGHAEAFWLRQDVPALLGKWGANLPRDRVHLVTVPPRGASPSTLWDRFAAVIGVDPATVHALPRRSNQSMGVAGTEVLRRLNERLRYSVGWRVYGPRITHHLAISALSCREDRPIELPSAQRGWVAAAAESMVARLVALDCTVTGDLADLRPSDNAPTAAEWSAEVPSEDLLEAALAGLAALLGADEMTGSAPPDAGPGRCKPVEAQPAQVEPELAHLEPGPVESEGRQPAPEPAAAVTQPPEGGLPTTQLGAGLRRAALPGAWDSLAKFTWQIAVRTKKSPEDRSAELVPDGP